MPVLVNNYPPSRRKSASKFNPTPPTRLSCTVKLMQRHLCYVRDQDRPWNPHSPIPFPERENYLLKVCNRLRIQLLTDNTGEQQQYHYFSKIHSAPTAISLSIQSRRSNPGSITFGGHQRSGYIRDSGDSSDGDRSISQHLSTSNSSGASNSGGFSRSGGSTAPGGANEREGNDEDAGSVEGDGDCSASAKPAERGFKCPIIEKVKKVQKMPKECKAVFKTQQAAREHAQKYHLACPICLHDPVTPRERPHSSKLTKGKTLKDTYFNDRSCLISHIYTHLKCLPCKNGCDSVFAREHDRKNHYSSCKSKSSGSRGEQLIPENLKALVEETKKCVRLSREEIVGKLEDILLLQAGPAGKRFKIYDAHDGTNNLDKLSTFSAVTSPEAINACPDGLQGDTLGEMFVRASRKSHDKNQFTLQFLSKLGGDDRRRIQAALNDTRKRSPSPTGPDEDHIDTQATKRLNRSHENYVGKDFPSHLNTTESFCVTHTSSTGAAGPCDDPQGIASWIEGVDRSPGLSSLPSCSDPGRVLLPSSYGTSTPEIQNSDSLIPQDLRHWQKSTTWNEMDQPALHAIGTSMSDLEFDTIELETHFPDSED